MKCLVNYATFVVVVFVWFFVCFDEVNSLLHISYFFSYLVTKCHSLYLKFPHEGKDFGLWSK